MNELEQKTITSLEVSEMVDKDHSKLLRDIRTYSEQLAEAKIGLGDYFKESTYKDANNQSRPCYLVTKKGCEFIAHKLTGVKGTEFTAKYIDKFHEMEDAIKSVIPTGNDLIALAVIEAQRMLAEKEKQIEEMQPKAEYFDALVDKKLNTNVRDTAKELGVKERVFVSFLLDKNYVFRQGKKGELRPYAQYAESGKGLFVLKDKQNENNGWAGQQMYITPKGKETFRLLLESEGLLNG